MNGRLDKVAMTNRLMQLKRELHYKCEIGEKGKWECIGANEYLNKTFDVLDEYWQQMLQKILIYASPIVSAVTVATVITIKSWKKKKPPNINITWDDDDDDDYTGGPGEGPYWWYTK